MPAGGRKHPPKQSVRPKTPAGPARGCPIVGIGASAGGLEAFTALLKQLPLDTGFGFVLVQHLDPLHESTLTQLLARTTALPVHEVTNNLRVLANHVYIIPPNTSMGIAGGRLKLQPRTRNGTATRSIDFFFEALAKDQQERAVGVILSGNASDGTVGLEAIKAEGGLTFAQDDTARYDSMPRSAIAAGCVDAVLPPAQIARELARIARHPYVTDPRTPPSPRRPGPARPEPAEAGAPGADGYRKILLLLRNHSGVDFSLYKSSTIHRRITRRVVLNHRESLDSYVDFLRGNPQELSALYADALISVTSFFRNADAFAVLKAKVLAPLLAQRTDDPLRVWVLGCATGQEAYSIAMLVTEAAEEADRPRMLQVFATDLNEANLDKARHGLYPKGITADVSPERLRRFFVAEEGGYRVIKTLREQVVFARHNLISDPPFSRMDLITCRNVMIYFEPSLQKRALPAFHYALKPDGCLFLGASESIGGHTDLFTPLDKKQKLFAKKAAALRSFPLPLRSVPPDHPRPGPGRRAATGPDGSAESYPGELSAEREADRVTVNQFAPPSVLINADLEILQFRGPTGRYLEPPPGKARFDLLKMAREGLMLPLRTVINQAKKDLQTARKAGVPFQQDGRSRTVNLEVVPLKNLKEPRFLILFEDPERRGLPAPADAGPPAGPANKREESSRITSLEQDLAETRDYLQSIQEQQESANEELQAANEEGQSANEELQSLNEELETSKEELESTNEELTTVNEEMVTRNTELNRLNSDLTNLQTSTKLAILLLGRDLTIRRFSAQAEKLFHLHPSDLGRPLGGLRHNLDLPDLEALITEVITSVRECERETQTRDGHWYSLRIRPYLTVDNKVDGAVLVLVDINDSKKAAHEVVSARDFAEAVISTVRDPLLILDASFRVQKANEAYLNTFKVPYAALANRPVFALNAGSWNLPRLRTLLRNILPRNSSFDNFEVTHDIKGLGRRTLLLNARMLSQDPGHREKILLGIEDVTDLWSARTRLQDSERRYRRLFETTQDGILILDPATRRITDANPFIVRLLGSSRKQLLQKELWQIGLLRDEAANRKAFRELKRKGFIRYEDLPLKSKGGAPHEVEFVSNLYHAGGQAVIQCNIRDITRRKQAEIALNRLAAIVNFSQDAIIGKDLAGLITSWNQGAERIFGYGPREMVGSSIRRLIPAARWAEELRYLGKIRSGDRMQHFETKRRTKNGRLIDVSVTLSPILDVAGRVVGISKVARDISVRKLAEATLLEARARLAAYAGQLESMVNTRTAQLTTSNRQLAASLLSTRLGEEQNRVLLLEEQVMRKKLRQLTHQILTAQEEERKKISRELHDEVVQTLVGLNVELAALVHGNAPGVRQLKDKIARTQRLVEKSVDAVHRFARDLRPAVLDDLGLIPALHAFCKDLAARKKFKIHLTAFAGVEALASDRRTVLYRVAQEALTNVARHARATLARVTISKIPGAVRMEISDNGKSFPVRKIFLAKSKRLGLVGMKERVEMVGGNLTIESVSGKGTTVLAEIPSSPPPKIP